MEILIFQILFATVLALITIIINMKMKHEKELEYYIREYRDINDELFQCKLEQLEKENNNE